MSAEVIVIVEHQDARFSPELLWKKYAAAGPLMRRPPPPIVFSPVACRRPLSHPRLAVAEVVGIGKCPVVIAAHSSQRGRIVVRRLFRREGGRITLLACKFRRRKSRQHALTCQHAANSDGRSVQEISPCNRLFHAEFVVALFIHHVLIVSRMRAGL